MPKQKMTFEEWFKEVKRIAWCDFYYTLEAVDSFDPDAWRLFYDEGETPGQAIIEDLSNA